MVEVCESAALSQGLVHSEVGGEVEAAVAGEGPTKEKQNMNDVLNLKTRLVSGL